MGEFDLIARYFTRPAAKAALGVGDDCALLQRDALYRLIRAVCTCGQETKPREAKGNEEYAVDDSPRTGADFSKRLRYLASCSTQSDG